MGRHGIGIEIARDRDSTQCGIEISPVYGLDSSGHQGVERSLAAEGSSSVPCCRSTRAGGDPKRAHVAFALDFDTSQAWL
jgi:hypothetical protein